MGFLGFGSAPSPPPPPQAPPNPAVNANPAQLAAESQAIATAAAAAGQGFSNTVTSSPQGAAPDVMRSAPGAKSLLGM